MANNSHTLWIESAGEMLGWLWSEAKGVYQGRFMTNYWYGKKDPRSDAEHQIALPQVTVPANLGKGMAVAIVWKSAGRPCFT